MVREATDKQLLVVVPGEEKPLTVSLDEVEERQPANSLMPVGLINQLSDDVSSSIWSALWWSWPSGS